MRPMMWAVLAMASLVGPAAIGSAQAPDDYDGPGRGVARLSLINGDVSVRRGDSGDWIAGVVNAPLVADDSVNTGQNSRAEVQFDWANMIRLAGNSEIVLAQLDNDRYIIRIVRGTSTFRVLRDSNAEVELSTPNVSVRPLKKGIYRVTVREDGQSEITVRSGDADIFTPRGSETLHKGKTMLVRGPASEPEYQIVSAIPNDDWDRWNENRDRYLESAKGYRYAGLGIYGLEDLDAYGVWVNIAPYGWCWYPRTVIVGWAPYSYGRWVWIDWYGWTWVDYAPWGWAPFHYGRWFHQAPYGWCWYPGPVGPRHYWRPALVAFFGFGGHGGTRVGFGFSTVGWVPLAPHEPYYPWYGPRYYSAFRNTTLINNVTVINNVNITERYRNARISNAVNAMDVSHFGRGGSYIRVPVAELTRTALVRGQLPVAPNRESLRWTNREVNATTVPRTAMPSRFFSHMQPSAVDRVPFETQRRAMEELAARTAGAPPGRNTLANPQTEKNIIAPSVSAGVGHGTPPNSAPLASSARTGEPGWRRFGGAVGQPLPGGVRVSPPEATRPTPGPIQRNRPATLAPSATPQATPNESGGWRRFNGFGNRAGERPAIERGNTGGVRSRQVEPSSSPRFQYPASPNLRNDTPQPRGQMRSAERPLRINSPIIRERAPQPHFERPSARIGGAGHSAGGGRGGRSR